MLIKKPSLKLGPNQVNNNKICCCCFGCYMFCCYCCSRFVGFVVVVVVVVVVVIYTIQSSVKIGSLIADVDQVYVQFSYQNSSDIKMAPQYSSHGSAGVLAVPSTIFTSVST